VDCKAGSVHVDQIVFTVNSFASQTFEEVDNAFCRLLEETTGQELVRSPSPARPPHRTGHGQGAAHGSGWQIAGIGSPVDRSAFRTCRPSPVTCAEALTSRFHEAGRPTGGQLGEKCLCPARMRIVEVPVPASAGGTSQVKESIGSYPRVRIEGGGRGVVSQAGAVLLVETVRKAGLDQAI
jgi:hypothetical protein